MTASASQHARLRSPGPQSSGSGRRAQRSGRTMCPRGSDQPAVVRTRRDRGRRGSFERKRRGRCGRRVVCFGGGAARRRGRQPPADARDEGRWLTSPTCNA